MTGPSSTTPRREPRRLGPRDLLDRAALACLVMFVGDTLITCGSAILSWIRTGEGLAIASLLRLSLLSAGLWIVALPFALAALAAFMLVVRTARWALFPRGMPDLGLAPWLWAGSAAVALYVVAVADISLRIAARFNADALEAMLSAAVSVFVAAGCVLFACILRRGIARVAPLLERLGRLDPLRHTDVTLGAFTVVTTAALIALAAMRPDLAPLVPGRHLLVIPMAGVGLWLSARLPRRTLLPGLAAMPAAARSATGVAVAAVASLLLLWAGSGVHAKYTAQAHSPPLATLMSVVRVLNDFDRDGYGSLLGENDCAPFDDSIHPAARDIPDNGIDENCNGGDFKPADVAALADAKRAPVPSEFQRKWNFLLLTIDTVRYDHTSFGGYIENKKRDTTPNLAKLVAKSVSFTFANAPSAGTMASIPAILTSKFFHSGIALGPDRKGMPPILKDSNVLLPELLKPLGYRTGAILSHYYFGDWGMKQGFDHYDNELGENKDAYKVTSDALTDKALAWIAREYKRPWFLWVHYLDPHGRYVAHPGEKSFGTSEEDLYDGELHFTDKHVGRLLDELAKMPGRSNTIVIITSDHGDGFNEHGFINHGMNLYRELLHVPLIFYVPGANPRTVGGAVTPLDIVPTIAQLAGADAAPQRFEGVSLVPQLFYDVTDEDRVVFAETNWPKPLRAAISESYKLVHHLKSNVYELYDLRADPWEKKNLWSRNRKIGEKMKSELDRWLERVFFARDFEANQVTSGALAGVLLEKKPQPQHPASGELDGGALRALGFDGPTVLAAGQSTKLKVYFETLRAPSGSYNFTVELTADGEKTIASRPVNPANGLFPTTRWRKGDFVAVEIPLRFGASAAPGPRSLDVVLRGGSASRASLATITVAAADKPVPKK